MLQEDDNFDSQALDSSLSLSPPSEPPDIKNWFSSYKYESPTPDTLNDLGCSSFKGSQFEEEQLDAKERNREKDENLGDFRNNKFVDESVVDENICPIGFFKCKRDNKLENCHLNQRNHDLCSRKIYEQGWAEPTKDVKKSSRNDEDSPELERNKRIGNNEEERSPTQLVQIKGSIQWNSEATEDDGNSKKVTSPVINDKENGGKGLADNGFVSTRKNRCRGENDKNYFNKPQEFQLEGSKSRKTGTRMVLSTGEKNGGEKRKALSEKTNLQNLDVAGIAGKWRCPQKGKPDTGPPLKQLRLERWVHRL